VDCCNNAIKLFVLPLEVWPYKPYILSNKGGRDMAKQKISRKIKIEVRATYAGCVCCGTWDAFDTGHVIAETRGGSLDMVNLRKMCDRCNGALRSANAEFARYATPNDGARAAVETNRAAWFAYCDAAIAYWDAQDKVEAGVIKSHPYKKPKPYAAPL
jgi:hypothetical protein